MKKTLAFMVALAVVAVSAQAATITWGTSAYLNGGDGTLDVCVCTNGTLVDTLNVNGSDITVAGVLFNSDANSGITVNGNGYGNFQSNPTSPTLDSNYNTLLDPARYAVTQITLSGLTIGSNYCVKVWSSDSRYGGMQGRYTVLDGVATLYEDNAGQGGTLGQQVVGLFTADATNQTIAVTGFNSDGSVNGEAALVNAVQICEVPEPATLSMLGVMGGLLFFARRRFKS